MDLISREEDCHGTGCRHGAGRLARLLAKPEMSAPIAGATKPARLDDALAAVDLRLTAEEVIAMEASYVPHPIFGHA